MNNKAIIKAILNAQISPSAKESAAILVQAWVEQFEAFDKGFKTLYVEAPWFIWLDPNTLAVGVMDRIAQDKFGIIGTEWKTTKEPKKNRDGEDSAYWNEEKWLEQLQNGPQLAFYGLALLQGAFCTGGKPKVLGVHNPRILVRAAVKATPPRFWPTNPADGVFEFPDDYLLKTVAPAILARAAGIRAMRLSGKVPWSLTGHHCTDRFFHLCPYHDTYCAPLKSPKRAKGFFDSNDPGYAAIEHSGANTRDPNLVILSASSYQTALQCDERYRILTTTGSSEESAELDVGTGLHIGVAEFYRGQMNPLRRPNIQK